MRKTKLKPLLLFAIVILSVSNSTAQIGIKLVQFRPTNDFGFIAKKAFGPEIVWKNEFDGTGRIRYYANFGSFKSRMDTIPNVTFVSSGNGQQIIPANYGFAKLWNFTFGVGYDYSPEVIEDWKIRPFIGLDLNIGAHSRQTFSNTGVSSISEGNLTTLFGVAGRFGLETTFENFGLFLEGTRNYNYYLEVSSGSYNSIGLGVFFILD